MIKSLQCILLISSMLSTALFGGRNVALTKEIENQREYIVCTVDRTASGDSNEYAVGYSDGFWMEEEGIIYFLKTYGNAVLEVTKNEKREILLSASALPTDVISDEENLYIYDETLYELQIYTKQGELLVRNKIQLDNDYVKGFTELDDEIAILTFGGKQIPIDCNTGNLLLSKATQIPKVEAAGYDCVEYIGTDEDGTVYSVHTTLINNCSVLSGEMTLRAVTADGKVVGSYVLPMMEYDYLPGQYIQVAENGNTYLYIPTENCAEIRKIALKDTTDSYMETLSEEALAVEGKYASNNKTANTLSREEVRQRADAMAEYEWTLKKVHTNYNGKNMEKGIILPREIAFYRAQNSGSSSWKVKLTGIPYCWGGFCGLDVGVSGKTFPKTVTDGYVMGNINPEGYVKYWTAGLDCSGYVSAALGYTSKKSTTSLGRIGTRVKDVKKLESMDILVYPGDHVIFFCDWIDDCTMLVSEATIKHGKVITHPKTVNELIVSKKYQMRSPW